MRSLLQRAENTPTREALAFRDLRDPQIAWTRELLPRLFGLLGPSWLVALGLSVVGCHRAASETEQQGAETGGGEPAERVSCGQTQCQVGQVCCNPSCGICAAPDAMCTQQFCDQTPPELRAGEPPAEPPSLPPTSCDQPCAPGTHCERIAVQCVRAPCEPVPQCVADQPSAAPKRAP